MEDARRRRSGHPRKMPKKLCLWTTLAPLASRSLCTSYYVIKLHTTLLSIDEPLPSPCFTLLSFWKNVHLVNAASILSITLSKAICRRLKSQITVPECGLLIVVNARHAQLLLRPAVHARLLIAPLRRLQNFEHQGNTWTWRAEAINQGVRICGELELACTRHDKEIRAIAR